MQVILEELKKAGVKKLDTAFDLTDRSVPMGIQQVGSKPIEGSDATKKIGFNVVVRKNYFVNKHCYRQERCERAQRQILVAILVANRPDLSTSQKT
jgi:hypothetical protein